MKLFILSLVLFTVAAQAKTVSSSSENIAPSSVDRTIRLVDKAQPGSAHEKMSILVEDLGMSTDVSPRFAVYLGYSSLAEMGNISADFKINANVYEFISAKVKSPGVYEVKVIEYRDDAGMLETTQIINAKKVFSDEKALRKECDMNFCDYTLKTSVEVTETLVKKK